MSFDRELYLKWIHAGSTRFANCDFNITNLCLFSAAPKKGAAVGITVFQPRDLTAEFFKKLALRQVQPEFSNLEMELFVPPFLKHRAEELLQKEKLRSLKINYTSFVNIKNVNGGFYLRGRMRVVNIDDSPVLLKFLKHEFEQYGFIDVVAQVSDPLKAVETVLKTNPDVITLDIQMPNKNGVEVVHDILAKEYFPIIMVSSVSLDDGPLVMNALQGGAFDYIQKPKLEERSDFREELLDKVLCSIEGRSAHSALQKKDKKKTYPLQVLDPNAIDGSTLWCLGASTGGTQALTEVFKALPAKIPPVLVVQHIPPVYSKSFADSANELCPFRIKEAEHGELVQPNHIYIAPGGMQMGVVTNGSGGLTIDIQDAPPVNRFKPSVDYLFHSVAKLKGKKIVSGILTGMGKDGANGMLDLKKMGAATIAQDEETSVVYGMPRAAVENGAANRQVPLGLFAQALFEESHKIKKSA